MFNGKTQIYKKDDDGNWYLVKESRNLFVDDGKELTLDFLFGRKSWWNPQITENYEPSGSEKSEWNNKRLLGIGESMFNNASEETRDGTYTIPNGDNYDYKVNDTWLVNPEDSFLSSELSGTRPTLTIKRRDQQVELSTMITPNVNAPSGTNLREFGVFLSESGPTEDPSLNDEYKPGTMISRSALFDTGYFESNGNEHDTKISGSELCYKDDAHYLDSEIKFRWIFGELSQ